MENREDTWKVRQVEDCPTVNLEGFSMYRILDGSTMKDVGCEYVVLKPGEILEPHVHTTSHSIILVLGGNGYAILNDERIPIKKNSVINIPPGIEHGLESAEKDLIVYGFQSPGIIASDMSADILFTKDNRQGAIV